MRPTHRSRERSPRSWQTSSPLPKYSPASFTFFPPSREIRASHNSLSALPRQIEELHEVLEVVDLAHNAMDEIPAVLQACTSLTELHFGHNAIESVSEVRSRPPPAARWTRFTACDLLP